MPSGLPHSGRWTCRRNDQGQDEQGPEQEQQPVTKLETPFVLASDSLEIADSRKDDRRRFTPGDQVQEERHPSQRQCRQHPRLKEGNHTRPLGLATMRRRAIPNGMSVVIRWYWIPCDRHCRRQSETTSLTVTR